MCWLLPAHESIPRAGREGAGIWISLNWDLGCGCTGWWSFCTARGRMYHTCWLLIRIPKIADKLIDYSLAPSRRTELSGGVSTHNINARRQASEMAKSCSTGLLLQQLLEYHRSCFLPFKSDLNKKWRVPSDDPQQWLKNRRMYRGRLKELKLWIRGTINFGEILQVMLFEEEKKCWW